MASSTVPGYVRETTVRVRHARNIFLIAVITCGVLSLNVTLLRTHPSGQLAGLRSCFAPLLFWSLTAAAYAFHALARANARLLEGLSHALTSDRMNGLRQIAAIRTRLQRYGSSER
jgi:uncharacterized membrane protein YesL